MSVDLIDHSQVSNEVEPMDSAPKRNIREEQSNLSYHLRKLYQDVGATYPNESVPIGVIKDELYARDKIAYDLLNELLEIHNTTPRSDNNDYYNLSVGEFGTIKVPHILEDSVALPISVFRAVIAPSNVELQKRIEKQEKLARVELFRQKSFSEQCKRLDDSAKLLAKHTDKFPDLDLTQYSEDLKIVSAFTSRLAGVDSDLALEVGISIDDISTYLLQATQLVDRVANIAGEELGNDMIITPDTTFQEIFTHLERLPQGATFAKFDALAPEMENLLTLSSKTNEAEVLRRASNSIVTHDMTKKWRTTQTLGIFTQPFDGKYYAPTPDQLINNEDGRLINELSLSDYIRELLSTIAYFTLLIKSMAGLPPNMTEFERTFSQYQQQYIQEDVNYESADGFVPVRTATLNAINEVMRIYEENPTSILASQIINVTDVTRIEDIPSPNMNLDSGDFVVDLYKGPYEIPMKYQVVKVTNYTSQDHAAKFRAKLTQYRDEVIKVANGESRADLEPNGGLRLAAFALQELGNAELTVKVSDRVIITDVDGNRVFDVDGQPFVQVEVYIRYPVDYLGVPQLAA